MPRPYYDRDGITLYHGDCRDVLPGLEAGSFGLCVTDPQYGISVAGSFHQKPGREGRRRLDFFAGDDDRAATESLAVESVGLVASLLSGRGSLYVFVGHRQFGPVVEAAERLGFETRFLVWSKMHPPPQPPGAGWPSAAELCVFAYRPGRTWNLKGRRTPRSNVIVADSYRHGQPGKVDHPTQKPMTVVAPLIIASARVGDAVLDPFSGSGTTLVAAKANGCKAVGVELEERYCEIAAKRLEQGVLAFGEETT
jgi:site-specific DNA-methyltransferase (adenine-specific)